MRAALCTAVLVLAACGGGPEPCASSASCPEGTACLPSGACTALERPRGSVGQARWLHPGQWGVTRGDRLGEVAPATDVVLLGGDADARLHLELGPLPSEGRVERALLRLAPHPSWSGPPDSARVVVDRTDAFDGARLNRRTAPRRVATAVAEGTVASGGASTVLVDLTDAVRRARRMGLSRLHLAVRLGEPEGPPWRLSSPRALDRASRPRLEIVLR